MIRSGTDVTVAFMSQQMVHLFLTFKGRGIGRRNCASGPRVGLLWDAGRTGRAQATKPCYKRRDGTFPLVAERLPAAKHRFREAVDLDRYRNHTKRFSLKRTEQRRVGKESAETCKTQGCPLH